MKVVMGDDVCFCQTFKNEIMNKKIKKFSLTALLLGLVFILSVFTPQKASAIDKSCSWLQHTCENGNTTEICTVIGDGNNCPECGSATREC